MIIDSASGERVYEIDDVVLAFDDAGARYERRIRDGIASGEFLPVINEAGVPLLRLKARPTHLIATNAETRQPERRALRLADHEYLCFRITYGTYQRALEMVGSASEVASSIRRLSL